MAQTGLQGIGHIPFCRDEYWRECNERLGYECITKEDIFKTLHIHTLPTMEKMLRSRAKHRVVVGGNRCLPADMRVQTDRGYITADEVFLDDTVACKSTNKFYPRQDKVVQLYKSDEKCPIYKLTTKRGYVLRGNAEHPLWAQSTYNSKQEWVNLSDLKPDMLVALEDQTDVWPESCSIGVEEAYFLGLMTGDGCWVKHDGAMTCDFDDKDTDSADRLERYLRSCNLTPRRNKHSGKQNSFVVEWCSIKFKNHWASILPLVKMVDKEMPEVVMRGTRDVMAAFLRGLFDADGCATTDGKVVFVTISEKLASQVHDVLLKFGVVSSLYRREPEPQHRRPSVSWRVQAGGSFAMEFAKNIGFESARKQNRIQIREHQTKRTYWDKVKSVELDGEDYVYGITTEQTNTYVANGFISHNSGKSFGAAQEILPYLFWSNTRGWLVSSTYDNAEEIRRKLCDVLVEKAGLEPVDRATNLQVGQFSYSLKTHTLLMFTGSFLKLKSAESPNSMHAEPLDYVVIDEAALLPYILYDTRIIPRLVDAGGHVLSIGTLEWQTGEWFEEYFQYGQVHNRMGIESWYHPTRDNYHLYIAKGGETADDVAAEYEKNFKQIQKDNPDLTWPLKAGDKVYIWNIDIKWLEEERERIDPAIFAARFEAKSSTNPYLVFPSWDMRLFVNDEKASFDPELPVYLAIDPGGTYAVAALQLKTFDDNGARPNSLTKGTHLCIIDELYFQTTVTTEEVYRTVREREWWPNVDRKGRPWWDTMQGCIDVTAREQERAWEHLVKEDEHVSSLHLMSQKVYEQDGIKTLQHFLDSSTLWVNSNCPYFCVEMRKWTYPPPTISKLGESDPRKAANPTDAWNHLTKAVIYFIVNKYGYYGRRPGKATMTRREIRQWRQELNDKQ